MVPVPYNHRGIAVEARRFTARLSGQPPHPCLSGIPVQMPLSTIQPHLFKFGTYPRRCNSNAKYAPPNILAKPLRMMMV
jgi:hypothetical protein